MMYSIFNQTLNIEKHNSTFRDNVLKFMLKYNEFSESMARFTKSQSNLNRWFVDRRFKTYQEDIIKGKHDN